MKPPKYLTAMLMLLAIFSFLRCKPGTKSMPLKIESEADRIASFNQYPEALYPVRIKNKWGYINRKAEIIIPPTWNEADEFHDGMAKVGVETGDQFGYGFIDVKGQYVVQPIYQKAGIFKEGFAPVCKNDLFGYVDHFGKEVIPFQFEDAAEFFNGFAAIKKGGWTGFIDKTGRIIVDPQYTVVVSHPRFINGLAPVFGADEQTGFIDSTGQFRISAQFNSAGNFVEGLAWAMWQQDDSAAEHGFTIKGGYIDTEGVFSIPPEYDFGWDFSDGYATVWVRSEDKQNKIWKIIDKTGEIILDSLPYRNVGSLHNDLIPIQDENMNWGFMNIRGEVVIPPQYAGIHHFENGMARMESGTAFENTIVYINPKGEVVWSEK